MGETAYIADSPLLLGVRWLRMELSLSVAMIYECKSRRVTGDETNEKERKGKERKEKKEVIAGCGEES